MGVNIKGGSNTTGLANVSTNYELQVVTPQTEINAGFVQLSTEIDSGSVLGTRTVLPLEASDDYRLRVGLDQTIFNSSFEGTSILTTTWSQLLTTQTTAQASGFMTLNSTVPTVTSGTAAYVRTWRHFPTFGTYPTYLDMWIKEANTTASNCISEWGFLYLTSQTATQVVDGIFFRRISNGALYAIITNSSVDISTTLLNTTNVPSRDGVGAFDPTETNHYLISYHNDTVRFWINDVVVAELACPSAYAQFTGSSNTPVGFRVNNTGTASATRQLSVGFVNVGLGDQNVNKPWQHALAGLGAGAYQVQQGNTAGPTVTRTSGAAGHPASATARIAGTWTATSAPALNSLGGLWTSPSMNNGTVASDADFPVFAYQNPTGTAVLPGKTLYVTGVRVGEAYVSTAASTNPMFLSYILMVGSSASTTSTADGATTVSGKSICIGGHGFTSTEAIGNYKPGFEMRFDSPLMIPAGHYFLFVVRPFGTVASNTLAVTCSLAVNGYFE
jgi:hypothetical protein